MPLRRIPLLLVLALPVAVALSCATNKPVQRDPMVEELRGQLQSQAEQLKAQEQRIEALEMRLAAVAARPPPPPPAPAPQEAPIKIENSDVPKMQTVKLHPPQKSGRLLLRHLPKANPVERAPRLPSTVELKEPDDERLAELDQPANVDPAIRDEVASQQAFAQAVQQLNSGDYLSAQTAFLAFAARYPRNASADNAVYFAGLARAASGDCKGALAQFDRTIHDYPAGDARGPARLEKGRCLLRLGQHEEGRAELQKLIDEDGGVLETEQARALLRSDQAAEGGAK